MNLKRIRKSRGYSQEVLADMCDTAKNYISQLESQKRFPSSAKLDRLSKELDVVPAEFFLAPESEIKDDSRVQEAEKLYRSIQEYIDMKIEEKLK